jgi:hypothetical protein
MKSKLIALAIGSCLLMQSCATVFSGNNANVRVPKGTAPNAKIYVDGNYTADVPETIKIPKRALRDGVDVTVKADGKEQTTKVRRKVQVGWLILDIITGLVWVGVDFATGDIYKATPSRVEHNLEKQ